MSRATSPFHAVKAMSDALEEAGFTRVEEGTALDPDMMSFYLVRNDSSIIAVRRGGRGSDGLRMVGAHTDSPCLMVKPRPERSKKGYQQLGVEVYGGALLNPWFDRDLSLAGRVSYIDGQGSLCQKLVDFRRPIAVIPSLAIHLDREANKNRSINPQTDILPLINQSKSLDVRELLKQQLQAEYDQLSVSEVLEYELCFYDTQPAAQVGLDGEFISSARLDNLLSCFAGLQAIINSSGDQGNLLVCNDHEEVGSMSAAGAQGPFLASVLQQLYPDAQTYNAMIDASFMISSDNAHGVHPNYASKHDDNHGPLLNGGPVIKTNANQRYASNSETAALFRQLCAGLDIPVQSFVVRSDMACGSTIGPITAAEIGVRTLDIGVPQFAMHSVRETCGSADPWRLASALCAFMDWDKPLKASRG